MDALLYKIKNDPYSYVSHMINYVILPDMDNDMDFAMLEGFQVMKIS
jgi:hypothetical protein